MAVHKEKGLRHKRKPFSLVAGRRLRLQTTACSMPSRLISRHGLWIKAHGLVSSIRAQKTRAILKLCHSFPDHMDIFESQFLGIFQADDFIVALQFRQIDKLGRNVCIRFDRKENFDLGS